MIKSIKVWISQVSLGQIRIFGIHFLVVAAVVTANWVKRTPVAIAGLVRLVWAPSTMPIIYISVDLVM